MKHRPAVRVALCILGVFLTATAVPELLRFAVRAVKELLWASPVGSNRDIWLYLYPAISVLRVLIGLYLLFRRRMVLNIIMPPHHAYCPSCGFDFGRACTQITCPACGVAQLARSAEIEG